MVLLERSTKMNSTGSHAQGELLTEHNINSLTELSIELWPECGFDEEKQNWQFLIDNSNHFVKLAKKNEAFVGFVHASIRHEYVEGSNADKIAYLEAIYTRPQYRNIGVAGQLLVDVEKWAKSRGLRQIASDTEISNATGQLFHKRYGFAEINRMVCFIKNL